MFVSLLYRLVGFILPEFGGAPSGIQSSAVHPELGVMAAQHFEVKCFFQVIECTKIGR
jgi:hypothetical protein